MSHTTPPYKPRHYDEIFSLVPQDWEDMSASLQEKRAFSVKFLDHFIEKKPQKPELVSSAHGKLKSLMFTIPNWVMKEKGELVFQIYKELFKKLPAYTQLVLITQEPCSSAVQHWVTQNGFGERTHIIPMPEYLNITPWAEDAYSIVYDRKTDERFFVEPNCFPRWADAFVGSFASKAINYNRCIAPLYFEGGNMLVGDDFFLMGADYPVISLKYVENIVHHTKESNIDVVKRLYKEYLDHKRDFIIVGATLPVPSRESKEFELHGEIWTQYYYNKNEKGTVQPVFHIDMFMSLAGRNKEGKYQILIGDPRLAADLLQQRLQPFAMAEIFDNIAESLSNNEFEIIRNPLPLIYIDDEKLKTRNWHFASSNNAIVEIDGDNKTVWLPTYGYGNWKELQITDDYNRQIWEKLGFNVVQLGDFLPLAEDSGSLHCIKKYLERD